MKEKIKTIIGMTLLDVFIMGVLIGIYFLGIAGIFEILGVQYQSIWSLVVFVISIFILGIPVDLVLGAMADNDIVSTFLTQYHNTFKRVKFKGDKIGELSVVLRSIEGNFFRSAGF